VTLCKKCGGEGGRAAALAGTYSTVLCKACMIKWHESMARNEVTDKKRLHALAQVFVKGVKP